MARFNFIGPTYRSQSALADCERAMNLYPEIVESGRGPNSLVLYGTPGLSLFTTLPQAPVRALLELNGQSWAVAGTGLFELFSGGGWLQRGTLTSTGPTVSMASNGRQLCIVTANNGYLYDISAQTLVPIEAAGFLGATQVECIDGYFICNQPASRTFFISNYMDGTQWSALKFANAEAGPSNLVGIKAAHRTLWCYGRDRAQCYYDSGDVNFPFAPVNGSELEIGCEAPFSIALSGNQIFWLGSDKTGSGVVYTAAPQAPQRISTHAVEQAIQRYATMADAVGYAYQDAGHTFYVLSFPAADATWVYDGATGMWHERGYWANGKYKAHLGRSYVFAFGKHLVGDYLSGNVYVLSRSTYTDNGAPIRRMRIAPHIVNQQTRTFYSSFRLYMETGVGLDGGVIPGTDPQITLCWSDDGGRTWGDEYDESFGPIGDYSKLVEWRRLGYGRDRVFRVVTSEPVPIALIDASVQLRNGRS
jgi:hypothetical protein